MNQKCSNSVGYKKWLWGYPIEVTCRILWLKGQGYNSVRRGFELYECFLYAAHFAYSFVCPFPSPLAVMAPRRLLLVDS